MAGLYIHIPLCRSRCNYCDFYSVACADLFMEAPLCRALADEMEAQAGFIKDRSLKTIYFGGGTPSLLKPGNISALLQRAGELFSLNSLEEITLEANPDDITPQWAEAVAAAGVNRLSIGIQSLDDDILRFMNRRHTASQAIQAVEDVRRAGFSNISIDLIYGVPGMTSAQWQHSIERAIALRPEHISAYHLTIEPGTPFGRRGLVPVDESVSDSDYAILCERLSSAGYIHYEISNFSLPGRHSRHNSSYWTGAPYLGLGPSAHSYDGDRVRRWNSQSIDEYLNGAEYQSETLTDSDLKNEYIMTRLRTADGISTGDMRQKFGEAAVEKFTLCVQRWLSTGVMEKCDQRYFITESNFLLSDSVISSLFE